MPAAFIYLLKLSVSLGIVFLFYQLVLRKITFYNWNRWYLLGYSLLSFVIPFIDISAALHQNQLTGSNMVQWIPLLYNKGAANTPLTVWNILSLLIIIGMVVMSSRLIIQLFSFRKMMKKAQLISRADISIYQVNETIIPFSFGNAVFINRHLHTEKELEEIIRHEFVHVKQRHSIDIILGEILCLLNWYNPFAWMLRSAIRQNLEFVADHKVLENGISKKQYQYLLLKVIGNNQFSIAQKFNFSSLKKRIAMMNKNKSAKLHLLRFLFLLPVLAFMLVSFRKEIGNTLTGKEKPLQSLLAAAIDTVPEVFTPNSKGYIINVKDQEGKCLLVIKDKSGKELKRVFLIDWNANASTYEAKYGQIFPPPPPPSSNPFTKENPMPAFLKRNPDVKDVSWSKNSDNDLPFILIMKKDGKVEKYNLSIDAEVKLAEQTYGSLPYPPPPPPPPPAEAVVQLSTPKNDEVNVVIYQSGNNFPSKTITANPLIILNGEIISKVEMDNLNPESIASVDVLKGNNATALYGDKANEGAIIIKTKTGTITTNNMTLNNGSILMKDSKALVILDGKELPSNREKLTGTFNVVTLNKEEAIKRYGDKGKNGVLELTTLK